MGNGLGFVAGNDVPVPTSTATTPNIAVPNGKPPVGDLCAALGTVSASKAFNVAEIEALVGRYRGERGIQHSAVCALYPDPDSDAGLGDRQDRLHHELSIAAVPATASNPSRADTTFLTGSATQNTPDSLTREAWFQSLRGGEDQ